MTVLDDVTAVVAPVVADAGCSLYDATFTGGKLVVAVARPGGIDLDTLTDLTRAISRRLDDADVVSGSYTLEVSSPGLERKLRTPAHFAGAVGDEVAIKTRVEVDGDRRHAGVLTAAGDDHVTVRLESGAERSLPLDAIDSARTVFRWGTPDKPTAPGRRRVPATSGPSAIDPTPPSSNEVSSE